MRSSYILSFSFLTHPGQQKWIRPRGLGSDRRVSQRLSIRIYASARTSPSQFRNGRGFLNEDLVLEHRVNSSVTSHYFIRKWCTLMKTPPGDNEVEAAVLEDLSSRETDRRLTVRGLQNENLIKLYVLHGCVHKVANSSVIRGMFKLAI